MTFPPFSTSFRTSLGTSVTRTATAVESIVFSLFPHGGQGAARRNAWAAMVEDNTRAMARREAEAAISRAAASSRRPAVSAR